MSSVPLLSCARLLRTWHKLQGGRMGFDVDDRTIALPQPPYTRVTAETPCELFCRDLAPATAVTTFNAQPELPAIAAESFHSGERQRRHAVKPATARCIRPSRVDETLALYGCHLWQSRCDLRAISLAGQCRTRADELRVSMSLLGSCAA
jgi:hypothetical protein